MLKIRPLTIVGGAFALLVGVDASAQVGGPVAAPKNGVTVTEGNTLTTVSCGQVLSRTYTLKNTSTAGLSSKVILNGVSTPFTLAKDEQKAVTASGGNYDCTKSLSINASIPNPTSTGALTLSLWSRKYDADKITYPERKVTVNGGDFMVGVTGSTCGSPMKLYLKYPSGTAGVKAKASIGSQTFDGTLTPPNAGVTYTASASLDCAGNIPQLKVYLNSLTNVFIASIEPSAASVSFKP